jgi:AraC-like DNA-binding protein
MTMQHEMTQLARTSLLLIRYAVDQGMDRDTLMTTVGLSTDTLVDPDSRIRLSSMLKLWRAVIEGLKDPSLGLNVGSSVGVAEMGLVGYSMYHSRDLRSALHRLAHYMRILSESVVFKIEESDRQAMLIWQVHPSMVALRHPVELGVTLVVTMAREITGVDIAPISIDLPSSRPESMTPYRTSFRCPISFSRPITSITFSQQQMDLPAAATDATLAGYLDELAAKTLAPLVERSKDLVTNVRYTLWSILANGRPDLGGVAKEMGISERTLQRRLAEEGSSFSKVLDDLRRDLADEFLVDRNLAVSEVAFLLGYSEPSAFQRAFRRWRGVSPRRFCSE